LIRRFFKRLFLGAIAIVIAAVLLAALLLQRSLPTLDGSMEVAGISAGLTIERDGQGIPTLTAGNRADLAFATGFVHGQDRFFQMDLMRRKAAGELAELFGSIAVPLDRRMRFHRFRSRASAVLKELSPVETAVLDAYASGVNAGLASLRSNPFEYLILRETPRQWLPEDSMLVAFAMFLDLNDARANREIQRGYAHRILQPAVFDWLYPRGSRWDAPLEGGPAIAVPLPGPDLFRLDRGNAHSILPGDDEPDDDGPPGSNNWAVAGSISRNGRAIVANDMHLGLSVPNVFYRARLVQTGTGARDVTGVTLPGTPVVISGSNRHVAWAFTNSYGDWTDAVVLRPGSTPGTYRTPQGDESFAEYREIISVKGGDDVTLELRETRWGPVLEDVFWPDGEIAVRWIGYDALAVNLRHLELETAASVDEAMAVANRLGIPPQNFVCGDAAGNIAWTIAGRIPVRSGYDPTLPADWSVSGGWDGWLPVDEYPRIVNPEAGRIWTANARVVEGDKLQTIGDGGYDLGARAMQIRDKLFAKDLFDTADMLAIQLDDRALFLTPWRDLLLTVLDGETVKDNPQRRHYRELVQNWQPRASADSVGYRLVRAFRTQVRAMVFDMLLQPVRDAYDESIELRISHQFEQPLWTLVTTQPAHLLSPQFANWHALLVAAVDGNIERYGRTYDDSLEQRTWGEFNTAAIRHPLSRSLDFFARWLDMPREPLDGDSNMPRVVRPDFGSSERFAVSPGDEEHGYMHMPAGQSGHPLSPYYSAGHEDWVHGRATPFLPGPPAHTLVLGTAPD
jgi:penicillin G amidase